MRWCEIKEGLDVLNNTRDSILDMLTPLQSQGVNKITMKQVIDQISTNPDISGLDITSDLIKDSLSGIKGFNIHTDSNGNEIIDLSNGNQEDSKKSNKKDQAVDKAAMRHIKKEQE